MHPRSALSYQATKRLVFRIELPTKKEPTYISPKNLLQELHNSTTVHEVEISGEHAVFRWQGEDDNDDQNVSIRTNRAQDYRYTRAVRFRTGSAAFLQIGNCGEFAPDRPDLRMVFNNFRQHDDYSAAHLFSSLRRILGSLRFLSPSRLIIDEVETSFLLKGLSLDDVTIAHLTNWARAQETVQDREGTVCGYQFGDYTTGASKSKRSDSPFTRHTKKPFGWKQTRALAIRDLEPTPEDLPAIRLTLAFSGSTPFSEFQSFNPLAGLVVNYADGSIPVTPVPCWNPGDAWSKVVNEIEIITKEV